MPYFKAKIHQIRFRLGLRSRPARGCYRALPSPLTGFKGTTSKRRGGKGGEVSEGKGETKKGEVKRRGGEERGMKEGKGRKKGDKGKEKWVRA